MQIPPPEDTKNASVHINQSLIQSLLEPIGEPTTYPIMHSLLTKHYLVPGTCSSDILLSLSPYGVHAYMLILDLFIFMT